MKSISLALAVSLLGLAVAGCSRDTLVHGPYLVGAERPPADPNCRPADVRSAYATTDWDKCLRPEEAAKAAPVAASSEEEWRPVVSSREEDLPNEVQAPVSAPAKARTGSRSAWQ